MYGRLYALLKPVCGAAVFMLLLALSVACQQATLIPSDPEDTRSTEEVESDSVNVEVDLEAEGWEGSIDVGFTFAEESEEGGNG